MKTNLKGQTKQTKGENMRMFTYKNNQKLSKGKIASFGLPTTTCLFQCKSCYAQKGRYLYPNVQKHLENNYKASLKADFVEKASKEINDLYQKHGIKYFRLHDSGDFYDESYVDKIYQIFLKNPHVIGYTYSKRFQDPKLKKALLKLRELPNFVLIDSLKFKRLNYFDTLEEAKEFALKNNTFLCPSYDKKTTCNNPCTYCMTKIAEKKV